MASNINFKDEDWNEIDSTIDLVNNLTMTDVPATLTFSISIRDSNGVTTTTTFVGGRPNDRK